jgi:hypothetical protein
MKPFELSSSTHTIRRFQMKTLHERILVNVLKYCLVSIVFVSANVQAQTDMASEQFNWRMGDAWRYDYVINGKNASETLKITNLTSEGVTISPAGETLRRDVLAARDIANLVVLKNSGGSFFRGQ